MARFGSRRKVPKSTGEKPLRSDATGDEIGVMYSSNALAIDHFVEEAFSV